MSRVLQWGRSSILFFKNLFQKLFASSPQQSAPTQSADDLNNYIHGVLETGDSRSYRRILCDTSALNDAIEKHRPQIGMHLPLVVTFHRFTNR
jgi:hypothetical protein